MSQISTPPDPSEEPNGAEHAPEPRAGDDLSVSTLVEDTPDVDLDRYLQAQARAARRASLIGKFLLGFVPVVALLAYLRMAGYLHRPSPTVRAGTNPAMTAADGGGFSVTGGPNAAPAAAATALVHTKKDPAVAKDLTAYVFHDLKAANPYEREALLAFQNVTGRNFRSKEETFQAIRQKVVPTYARFIAGAEAIHPKTAPVQAVHRLFLASANVKMLGFKHTLEGEGDPQGLWQFGVKAEFDASAQFANQFKSQIAQLAGDQGVKLP